jgi:UDP-3-O-[3-hydroxymyristoyl] N-acetylglucosamine deacetylase
LKSDTVCFNQKTLGKEVNLSGIGLFTGEKVSLVLKPAEENHGIVFQRTDLPDRPKIPANLDFVKKTPRCTILGNKEISILTVEHLLSALNAYEIDNLKIELHGSEVPVSDGSSKAFVDLIEEAGIKEQKEPKKLVIFKKPIYWTEKDVHIIALPSKDYRISYLLDYPQTDFLKSQYYATVVSPFSYKNEISPCRTFSIYEEIEPLLKSGFIKGGCLDNAVIIKENRVLNPEGIRFSEEPARHKILDLIGDLSLLGGKIFGHIIAVKSGHYSNISFAKKALKMMEEEKILLSKEG